MGGGSEIGVIFFPRESFKVILAFVVLPALLQKLVGEFFLFRREISCKFGGSFAGFFSTHKIKAEKIGEISEQFW